LLTVIAHSSLDSLPDAQRKQEECATNIEKFLSLIQTLNEHKAELTTKVETLAIEKSTMEQEQEDCVKKIEQLKQTINGQELSQEDVRRMEREKARIEEQVAKQSSILDGHIAALTEVKEKWSALYQLLEDRITEYKVKARQLELIPKTAKHAKGVTLEVVLDKSKAADGEAELMGGMDFGRTVKGHVMKTIQDYVSELAKEQRSTADVNGQIRTTDRSFVKLIEDIEVSVPLLLLVMLLLFRDRQSDHPSFVSSIGHQGQNHIWQRRMRSTESRAGIGSQRQRP
jgi:chromosome segregation ATPase